ncbi:unnamed protein product [Vicia faba]|uniref:Transmembrane protein n=1 Tax=Vicia faba TaxID=3906 RepID=A0AAV1ABH5_VICFA|nr:unnamed protein product [Vicia faba]
MAGLVRPRSQEVVFNILNNVQLYNIVADNNIPHHHTFVAFALFLLLGFLQLKHPQNPTPFQIHPNITFVSIASSLAYCFLFWVRLKFAIHVNTLMEVFGSLSLISMVLLFLPSKTPWGELLKYITYTIWFIIHVVAFIIKALFGEHMRRKRVVSPLFPY